MKMIHALVALSLSLCAAVASVEADELRLTASEWHPYIDADVQGSGFAVVLVSRALERAGYDVSIDIGPWPESLEDTVAGAHDVFVTLWFTDERAESILFSEPYIENEITFVRRSASGINFRERAGYGSGYRNSARTRTQLSRHSKRRLQRCVKTEASTRSWRRFG